MSMVVDDPGQIFERAPSKARILEFSSTNFGKSLFWTFADVFCLVFATDTLGIEPALAGTFILMTLFWDAVSDPLVGLGVDRFRSLNRSYGSIISWSAPVAGVSLVAVFFSQFAPSHLQLLLFVTSLIVFRTSFTLFDIPDNALFARIAKVKSLRIFTSSSRKILATFAAVLISIASAWVFTDHPSHSEGYRIMIAALVIAPLAAATLVFGALRVRSWDNPLPVLQVSTSTKLITTIKNPTLFSLTMHMAMSTLGLAIFMGTLVYYARWVLGHDAWFAAAMTSFLIAQAIGVFVWGIVAARLSSRTALTASTCLCVASIIGFFASSNSNLLLFLSGAMGFGAGGLNTLRWALAPAVIDIVGEKSGSRPEATSMAVFSLAIKTAIGVSSLVIGILLSLFGYEPDVVASNQQAIWFKLTIGTVAVLALLGSLIPLQRSELASH